MTPYESGFRRKFAPSFNERRVDWPRLEGQASEGTSAACFVRLAVRRDVAISGAKKSAVPDLEHGAS
jgi:hypothetical protein